MRIIVSLLSVLFSTTLRAGLIQDYMRDPISVLSQSKQSGKIIVGCHIGKAPARAQKALDEKGKRLFDAIRDSDLYVACLLENRFLTPEVLRKDPFFQIVNPNEIDAAGVFVVVASPDGAILEKYCVDQEETSVILNKIAATSSLYKKFATDVIAANSAPETEKAGRLDKILSSMPEEYIIYGCAELVEKIKDLDQNGSLGLSKKYKDMERRIRVEQRMNPLLAEMDLALRASVDAGNLDEVLNGIDNFVKIKKLEGEIKQVMLIQKVRFTSRMEDLPRRIKFLQEIVDINPSTLTAQSASKIIGRLKDRMAAPAGKP